MIFRLDEIRSTLKGLEMKYKKITESIGVIIFGFSIVLFAPSDNSSVNLNSIQKEYSSSSIIKKNKLSQISNFTVSGLLSKHVNNKLKVNQ